MILSLCMVLSVCGMAAIPAFGENVDWSDPAAWPASAEWTGVASTDALTAAALTAAALTAAAASGGLIRLTADITGDTIEIPAGVDVVLDLNGKTLRRTAPSLAWNNTRVINVLGSLTAPGSHDFNDSVAANVTVVPATCTENGGKTVKCFRCDAAETTVLAALGHDWGEWTVVTPETETEKGVEERVCARCGKTETRETGSQDDTPGGIAHCRDVLKRIVELFKKLFRLLTQTFNRVC